MSYQIDGTFLQFPDDIKYLKTLFAFQNLTQFFKTLSLLFEPNTDFKDSQIIGFIFFELVPSSNSFGLNFYSFKAGSTDPTLVNSSRTLKSNVVVELIFNWFYGFTLGEVL